MTGLKVIKTKMLEQTRKLNKHKEHEERPKSGRSLDMETAQIEMIDVKQVLPTKKMRRNRYI